MTVIAPPRLLARTVEVDPVEDLLTWLPPEVDAHEVVSWVREGEGIVGWGRAAGCMPHGQDRFAAAEAWWPSDRSASLRTPYVAAPSWCPGSSSAGAMTAAG